MERVHVLQKTQRPASCPLAHSADSHRLCGSPLSPKRAAVSHEMAARPPHALVCAMGSGADDGEACRAWRKQHASYIGIQNFARSRHDPQDRDTPAFAYTFARRDHAENFQSGTFEGLENRSRANSPRSGQAASLWNCRPQARRPAATAFRCVHGEHRQRVRLRQTATDLIPKRRGISLRRPLQIRPTSQR
jgi:hypothetical protein